MTNRHKGIIAIIISALGFSLMNLLVPVAGALPSIQKSFFRNFIALLITGAILLRSHRQKPVKEFLSWRQTPWHLLVLRSLLGTIGLWCNFYTMDHLLISDASVLNKLSPFATLVFSFIFLKEPMKKFHFVILAIAFSGVLFVVKPTLASTNLFPYLVGILGGVCAGGAYTCVRKLNERTVTPAFIIFFFSLFATVVSIPQLVLEYHAMSIQAIITLIGVGAMAAVGQFGITFAYKFAPASEISVFDYTTIVFTGMWGLIFLHQRPDIYSILGYLLIISAGILSFWWNKRKKLG